MILGVAVFPAGAPTAGAFGTALYAEISRIRGLKKGVAVDTAKRAERAIVGFIFAESEVLEAYGFIQIVEVWYWRREDRSSVLV